MPTMDATMDKPELDGKRTRSAARTKGAHNDRDRSSRKSSALKTDSDRDRGSRTLPAWLPEADWLAFLGHRKAMKAPMTEIAEERAIATLVSLREQGHDPVQVINASIVNGWRGLFPLRGDQAKTANQPFAVRGKQSAVEAANRDAMAQWLGDGCDSEAIEVTDYARC